MDPSRMFGAVDEIQPQRILRVMWAPIFLYTNLFTRHAKAITTS